MQEDVSAMELVIADAGATGEGVIKVFKHVLPRLDPDLYQCSIPEEMQSLSAEEEADLQRLAGVNWYKGTRCVSSNSEKCGRAIDEFLAQIRNIFEPTRYEDEETWSIECAHEVPLESDAQAIEFLAEHDYNVDKALFHLYTLLNYGKDVVHTRKTLQYIEKYPAAAAFVETKEKVLRTGAQKPMLGAYTNSEMDEALAAANSAANSATNGVAGVAGVVGGGIGGPGVGAGAAGVGAGAAGADGQILDLGAPQGNPQNIWENTRDYFRTPFPRDYAEAKGQGKTLPPPTAVPKADDKAKTSRQAAVEEAASSKEGPSARIRVGLVDKQESKKRWQNIMKSGLALLQRNGTNGSGPTKHNRGSVVDAQNLLDDAAQLPPFTDAPGDDFAEVLRVLLADLLKAVCQAREFIAKVRDALSPQIAAYGKRANTFLSIVQLKSLLSEGGELPLSTPEEKYIRDIISTVEKVNRFTRKLQSKCESMVTEENADMDVEDQIERFELEEVSDMLRVLNALPLDRAATASLEDIYQQALSLGEAAAEYVESANSYSNRTKVRAAGEIPRASLDEAKKLVERMANFPVNLAMFLIPLEAVYGHAASWKEEVRQLVGKTTNSRSSAGSDGNKPGSSSIKRVEALILEGEKMIFDVSSDLEALRDKRTQAKEWLERLKKSFAPKTARAASLRKSDAPGAAPAERIALADMKLMVLEGEQLYDDEEGAGNRTQTSRELSKAHSVVEVAEEWLSRVREALADSSSSAMNSAEMKELLGESEDMPVFMEEALVLRSHLNALEWSKRAKRVLYANNKELEANKMAEDDEEREGEPVKVSPVRIFARAKLSEVQRLAREINKIRSELPESIANEFALTPLQEETDCLEIVKSVEEWTSQMKRMFQSGAPRKGVKLEKLRALYEKGTAIPIAFDNELRPVRMALQIAENWIHSNARILTKMGIACNLRRAVAVETDDGKVVAFEKDDDKMEDAVEDGAAATEVLTNETGIESQVLATSVDAEITYEAWRRVVSSAEAITIEFDELNKARECLSAVNDWIAHIQEKCPKRFAGTLGKRTAAVMTTSSVTEGGWPSKFLVKRSDIEEMLAAGERLALDMKHEKQVLKESLAAVEKWDEEGKKSLEDILSGSIVQALQKFHSLGKETYDCLAVSFKGCDMQMSVAPTTTIGMATSAESSTVDNNELLAELLVLVKAGIISRKKAEEAAAAVDAPPSANLAMKKEKPKEELLWQEVQDIKLKLENLQHQGEEVGISASVTLTVDISIAAVRWMETAREMLNPFRRKRNVKDRGAKDSTEWGDVTKEHVIALMEDALFVVSPESRELTTAALLGTRLAQAPSSMSKAAEEYHQLRQGWENSDSKFSALFGQKLKKAPALAKNLTPTEGVQDEGAEDIDETGDDAHDDGGEMETGDAEGVDTLDGGEAEANAPSRKKGRSGRKKSGQEGTDLSEGRPSRKRQRSSFLDKDLGVVEKKPRVRGKTGEASGGSPSAGSASSATLSSLAVEAVKEEKTTIPVPRRSVQVAHFATFKKMMQSSGQTLPAQLQGMVDFYMRCLGVLLVRLLEADQWAVLVQGAMHRSYNNRLGGASSKQYVEEMSFLLTWATRRNIESASRLKLEEAVIQVDDWVRKATAMKRRDAKALLDVDDLRDFCRDGEKLLHDRPEVADMREELRRAKNWIKKLQGTGIEKGTALTQDLQALLPESETICADLSIHVEAINSTVKTYCLCRQAYFGHMVGCDTCDDWYHLPCVGLNKLQADKIDKYNCIRCNFKASFDNSAIVVAQTANKWMNAFELKRDREQRKLKWNKRSSREQRELERLEKRLEELKRISESMSTSATSNSMDMERSSENQDGSVTMNVDADYAAMHERTDNAPVVDPPVSSSSSSSSIASSSSGISQAAVASQLKQVPFEIDETRKRLHAAESEESTLTDLLRVETEAHTQITAWMRRVQSAVWPSTPAEIESGRPLGNDIFPAAVGQTSVEQVQDRALALLRTSLLPPLMTELFEKSRDGEFADVEDVVIVLEAFRWMSWCNIALQTMRVPATTCLIKKLIASGESLKTGEDRLVRFFKNLQARALAWKSKARKTFQGPEVKYETAKLNALLLEGNQIPFSTRIKDVLRTSMERVITASKPRDDDAFGSGEPAEEKAKRGPKSSTMPGLPNSIYLTSDPANSSDEEGNTVPVETSLHLRLGMNVVAPRFNMWPVKIAFPRSSGVTPVAPLGGGSAPTTAGGGAAGGTIAAKAPVSPITAHPVVKPSVARLPPAPAAAPTTTTSTTTATAMPKTLPLPVAPPLLPGQEGGAVVEGVETGKRGRKKKILD